MASMKGKTVLVSGGTSGIGKAAAEKLKAEGASVVVLARNPASAEQAGFEAIKCDLESQASVRAAVAEFLRRHPSLDVLILSAGIFAKERSETVDGIEKTFAVNYLSHFLLVNLLKPALEKAAPSRVVLISSRYGGARIDFDDLMLTKTKFSVMSSVPRTKLAEVLFAQEAAERWAASGIRVNAIHPGLVSHTKLLDDVGGIWKFMTNLFGGTAEQGADTAVWLATASEASELSGRLVVKRKPVATPGQGSDPAARKRLWDESVRLTAART